MTRSIPDVSAADVVDAAEDEFDADLTYLTLSYGGSRYKKYIY